MSEIFSLHRGSELFTLLFLESRSDMLLFVLISSPFCRSLTYATHGISCEHALPTRPSIMTPSCVRCSSRSTPARTWSPWPRPASPTFCPSSSSWTGTGPRPWTETGPRPPPRTSWTPFPTASRGRRPRLPTDSTSCWGTCRTHTCSLSRPISTASMLTPNLPSIRQTRASLKFSKPSSS